MPFDLDSLRRVVVLTLENRSFDHVLGWLQLENSKVDGILSPRAQSTGPMSKCDPLKDRVHSFDLDPPHEAPYVAVQISDSTAKSYRHAFEDHHKDLPLEQVHSEDICRYYTASELPITYFLAREYAVCDRWFCSVPTSTMPNRLYSMCGDSAGHIKTPIKDPTVPLTSIFDLMGDDWAVYSGGLSMSMTLGGVEKKRKYLKHQRALEEFQMDCQSDVLPALSWIEPRYDWMPHPNDDHPPTAVEAGQQLIKYVYEALHFHSKDWFRSVLIITYDEHGGFYDHVSPEKIPEDARTRTDVAAGFTTYGPRVPAIIVSPFVDPGTVYSNIAEHSSILKFICKWKKLDSTKLSPRVTSVKTDDLMGVFNRSAARLDFKQAPPAPEVPARFVETKGVGPSPTHQQSKAISDWMKKKGLGKGPKTGQ